MSGRSRPRTSVGVHRKALRGVLVVTWAASAFQGRGVSRGAPPQVVSVRRATRVSTTDFTAAPPEDVAALDGWMRAYCEEAGFRVPATTGPPTAEEATDDDATLEAVPQLPALAARGSAIFGADALVAFERRGHACARGLLTPAEVDAFAGPLRRVAALEEIDALRHAAAMNQPDDDDDDASMIRTPFLQTFNPHRRHRAALALATSPRLVDAACELLGVDAVRLYQTSIFRKRPGDLATNWHADLVATPLDTNHFVTAWLPLADLAAGATGLTYATGSHRDVALQFWYGDDYDDASDRYDLGDHGAMTRGDVSWHHGWTLHAAREHPRCCGTKEAPEERVAFAVNFVADGARLVDGVGLARLNDEDAPSYAAWIDDLDPGEPIGDHPLLPRLVASSSSGPAASAADSV